MDDSAVQRIGDEIAELSAHLSVATAHLLDLIGRFDAEGGWNNGFRSCAEWLAWRTGLDLGAAREKVRVARALPGLPHLARALAHGELSYAKVRALTRVATPETEERLLKFARAGTAQHIERLVRGWRWMDRKAEREDAASQHKRRALHVHCTDDGSVVVRGRLAPEVGALLIQALDAARDALYQRTRASDAADVSAEQQQADALALLAETAYITASIPALRASGTRSSSTWTLRCWPTPTARASRSSRTAPAFPRKRRSAWPATPAG